jgi:hypothetical protein
MRKKSTEDKLNPRNFSFNSTSFFNDITIGIPPNWFAWNGKAFIMHNATQPK